MKVSLTVAQYLRWFKSIFRRIGEDIANHRRRQEWWAQDVSISPLALIRTGKYYRLEIGPGSLIGPYTILDLQNDPLDKIPVTSVIKIGQRTAINEFNNIRASGGEILIGDNCVISEFVSIIATNYSTARGTLIRNQMTDTTRTSVQIGDDVWIGTHAIILPGSSIGTGSVIGAGAVITSDIPEYAVAVGVPAQVIRFRK
jgi:acetyltransferase-like isoleucine patch superfamily enzyme